MPACGVGRTEVCLLKDFLRKVSLFQDLEEDRLAQLAGLVREETYPSRHVIYREGEPVDALYLVREGLVAVFREVPGKPMEILARLEEGGYFGEMGLLNDKARRFASARTLLPTTLLRIDKKDLIEMLAANPGLELKLRAEVIRRHGVSVSSLLPLAGQRDVRIRLGAEALIELPDGSRQVMVLENLAIGGVGLSRTPDSWQPGQPVRFLLGNRQEPALLNVQGTISWREGDAVGIAFDPGTAGNAGLLQRVLRSFLDAKR